MHTVCPPSSRAAAALLALLTISACTDDTAKNDTSDVNLEDGTDGGTADGATEDGAADGTADGAADGSADGTADGSTDGAADGGSDTGTDGGTDGGTDAGTDGGTDGGADGGTDGGTSADYSLAGTAGVTRTTGSSSISGCTMTYARFTPAGGSVGPLVVIGHGFSRSGANMEGWAEHYASWGLEVVVPDLCHSSFLDSDHIQNGRDMADLARAVRPGPVVFMGQSAGGLAALVAATESSDAVGLVGLDPVDDFTGSGEDFGAALTIPAWGFVGEPGICNSSGNGVAMYGAGGASMVRVTEADHCDFENETDWGCTTLCNFANLTYSDSDLRRTILGMTTAAVLDLGGVVSDADGWLSAGGTYYDPLLSDGAISLP